MPHPARSRHSPLQDVASPLNWCKELFWIHRAVVELFYAQDERDEANAHIEQAKSMIHTSSVARRNAGFLSAMECKIRDLAWGRVRCGDLYGSPPEGWTSNEKAIFWNEKTHLPVSSGELLEISPHPTLVDSLARGVASSPSADAFQGADLGFEGHSISECDIPP